MYLKILHIFYICLFYYDLHIFKCNNVFLLLGSQNGEIKLWRCGDSFKSLHPLFTIKLVGFINSLVFTPDGNNLIAGVGQEHRLGRWWRIPEARNCITIIPLVQNKTNK